MKKIIFLLCLVSLPIVLTAQKKNEKTLEDFDKIKNTFKVDDNGNITYTKIIKLDSMSKEDIYSKAKNYFIYNYNNGKSVIQTEDKEHGTIIGKGLYANIYQKIQIVLSMKHDFETWHILRIDAKDGKARIILSLTEYEYNIIDSSTGINNQKITISETYPINTSFKTTKGIKNMYLQAFINSHERAINTILNIEKALKEGNTSSNIENEDW